MTAVPPILTEAQALAVAARMFALDEPAGCCLAMEFDRLSPITRDAYVRGAQEAALALAEAGSLALAVEPVARALWIDDGLAYSPDEYRARAFATTWPPNGADADEARHQARLYLRALSETFNPANPAERA